MRGKFYYCILFCLCIAGKAESSQVWINLYNSLQVQNLVVSAYNGALTAKHNGKTAFTIARGEAVYLTLSNNTMIVTGLTGIVGSFDNLEIEGLESSVMVRLKPVIPAAAARGYENAVLLSADIGRIRMTNRTEEAHYLAGVIEAETGAGRTPEFYKAKAVICRTYLYGQADRHASENFHLCDETHCQVYKGRCRYRPIIAAIAATGDTIITYEGKPIQAMFHANCGGETESARIAWQSEVPYLVPVEDPFCAEQPSARWTKTIPLDDWLSYLVKNGFRPDPALVTDFSMMQEHRKAFYRVNDFSLPTKQIRKDWNLRSTFFNISIDNDRVTLNGRGYGHGVGLCQEGASEMGRRGYSYDEIIRFYYRGVELSSVAALSLKLPAVTP